MSAPVPKIVILTSGYINGRNLARALHALGHEFEIVTICFDPPRRRNRSLPSHALAVADAYVKSIGVLRRFAQRRLPAFPLRPRYTGFCNGRRTLSLLRELQPDYIFMMGGGILSEEIIRTARIGVLNSHPGLLPWIRGVDVIQSALLREVAIGVTCHFIDVGIDTGDIIGRYLLPVAAEDTLATLLDRANQLECAAMLELAERVLAGQTLPRAPQTERLPLCRALTPQDHGRARQLVLDGKAVELHRTWRDRLPAGEVSGAAACIERYLHVLASGPEQRRPAAS